jgi:hypothetical protein
MTESYMEIFFDTLYETCRKDVEFHCFIRYSENEFGYTRHIHSRPIYQGELVICYPDNFSAPSDRFTTKYPWTIYFHPATCTRVNCVDVSKEVDVVI